MHIETVEIRNFRKLSSVRLDLSQKTTLLVGANNSGKTSALIALRSFLKDGIRAFGKNDLTLSHWRGINDIGASWLADEASPMPKPGNWREYLPSLDVWLRVSDVETHRVSALIPTLDWTEGLVGVRFVLEPDDQDGLARSFKEASLKSRALKTQWKDAKAASRGDTAVADAPDRLAFSDGESLSIWPESLMDFISRDFQKHMSIRYYMLDPAKLRAPHEDAAVVQALPETAEPLASNPLEGIVRIDEINAQRGLGDINEQSRDNASGRRPDTARLSRQLGDYYSHHLDPSESPGLEDLDALLTIAMAQKQFDVRLGDAFKAAFDEMATLSYPGITDPRIRVASKLSTTDSLNHESAVSFALDIAGSPATRDMHLPEGQNGLGYQNLISMVFRLMSFRDRWMRVGKASKSDPDHLVEPIHLVLVEEPEAHLHVQVQQVFAKKAFEVLRQHPDLGSKPDLTTQLVLSTHSSHIAHELPFESLRYFRRLQAGTQTAVPTSSVINVGNVFGPTTATQQFVTRFLRVQHADVFFADALLLVEGAAERMLIPHFIKKRNPKVHHAYVTMLEIGGSHAHRLRPLIDALKIPTLVITDLDPQIDNRTTATARSANQKTGNPTLKQWLDNGDDIDSLLDAPAQSKELLGSQQHAVRFAYQTPANVSLPSGNAGEVLPTTFEDALAFENVDFFSSLSGVGLTKKIATTLSTALDVTEAASDLHEHLRSGSKAELALDVLAHPNFDGVLAPRYVKEGLDWLETRLSKSLVVAIEEADHAE
ncbi:MAG: AAA family ATPase [Microbacteriaceae bacterium]